MQQMVGGKNSVPKEKVGAGSQTLPFRQDVRHMLNPLIVLDVRQCVCDCVCFCIQKQTRLINHTTWQQNSILEKREK
jgi:hypothetical protein